MESQVETFSAEVISNGRITIPDFLRRKLSVKLGSVVTVKILAVDNEAEQEA